ncbi:hypothetical protein Hanom_Chr09g00815291 [Helianthus anomalus]
MQIPKHKFETHKQLDLNQPIQYKNLNKTLINKIFNNQNLNTESNHLFFSICNKYP